MLTARSPRCTHDDYKSPIKLMPHQLAMLYACRRAEQRGKWSGVLCSPPGSGKTMTILALSQGPGLTLVVVPQGIHSQWLSECARFGVPARQFVDYSEIMAMYNHRPDFCGILVTEALMYLPICQAAKAGKVRFARIVLDESESLQWYLQAEAPSDKVWKLSATANAAAVHVFVFPNFARDCMALLEPEYTTVHCHDPHVTGVLNHMLPARELEAAYAGDFTFITNPFRATSVRTSKEAVKLLVQANEDQVRVCQEERPSLESLLRSVIDEARPAYQARIDAGKDLEAKARSKVQHIRERLNNSRMCNICLEELDDLEVTTKCCQNVLCHACLKQLRQRHSQCPLCRQAGFEVIVVTEDSDAQYESKTDGSKVGMISRIASLPGKHLIFSNWSFIFEALRPLLTQQGVQHVTLDGGNKTAIDQAVHSFKYGQAKVLLADATFFGRGLNLETTTDVVLVHRMNSKDTSQVVGRAQRPGRTQRLKVWQLRYPNEKEDTSTVSAAGC